MSKRKDKIILRLAAERDHHEDTLKKWESLANAIMTTQLPFVNDSTLVPVIGIRLLDHYMAANTINGFQMDECKAAIMALLSLPDDPDSKRAARELLNRLSNSPS